MWTHTNGVVIHWASSAVRRVQTALCCASVVGLQNAPGEAPAVVVVEAAVDVAVDVAVAVDVGAFPRAAG